MKMSIFKLCAILKLIGLTTIIGCGGLEPFSPPLDYSIKLNEHGGMVPYSTTIFLSNRDTSYVQFFSEGVENRISIFPSQTELDDLVKNIHTQRFSKITTTEKVAYDRGGSAVRIIFDGKKKEVADLGFSFVDEKWRNQFFNVANNITAIAGRNVTSQMQNIEVELDSSLLKNGWLTRMRINPGVFIKKEICTILDGFHPVVNVPVMIGANKMKGHVLVYDENTKLNAPLYKWNETITVTPEIKKLKFQLIDGKVQVLYNDTKANPLSNSVTFWKTEIIEHQNLRELSEHSIITVDMKSEMKEMEYSTLEMFEASIYYKDEAFGNYVPLLNTEGSFEDSYAPISYSLIVTANKNIPFILFYSGQAGDEVNTNGRLIFFSKQDKLGEIELRDGNRIHSELLEVGKDFIKVKEAFICHQEIHTTFELTNDSLKRIEGFFPPNTIYPNQQDISDASDFQKYELKSDLVMNEKEGKNIYEAGENIIMQLRLVDYDFGLVYLTINDTKGWLPIEEFKHHEFVQSMSGAKCEME